MSTTVFNVGIYPVPDDLAEHIAIDARLSSTASYKVSHGS
jgi:hypothetical protein